MGGGQDLAPLGRRLLLDRSLNGLRVLSQAGQVYGAGGDQTGFTVWLSGEGESSAQAGKQSSQEPLQEAGLAPSRQSTAMTYPALADCDSKVRLRPRSQVTPGA